MKKRILSILLTVALILSFGLMAAPVMAAEEGGQADLTGTVPPTFSLTTSVNPTRVGYVTVSSLGGVAYAPEPVTVLEGTTLNIEATPGQTYKFVNWAGDTDTIGDVNAASTTITMNGDYVIVANFVEKVISIVINPMAVGFGPIMQEIGRAHV